MATFLKWAGTILAAILPLLFTAGEAQAGNYGTAAAATGVSVGAGGLVAWLTGLWGGFKLPGFGTPAELQTAIAELAPLPAAFLALVKSPGDFNAAKGFLVKTLTAEIAVGDFFIDDAEWSAAAVAFRELTHAKLDAAAPKTAVGEPVPAGMVTFAEAASK